VNGSPPKSNRLLLVTHPKTLHWNLSTTFWVNLLTDRPTKAKHNLLDESNGTYWVNVRLVACVWKGLISVDSGPLLPTTDLIIPAVRLINSHAFPVAGACIWNTLPLHVTSASSLTVFKQNLKLHLFCFSFPGLSPVWLLSGPCSVCCHLGHYKIFCLIDCLRGWWVIDTDYF